MKFLFVPRRKYLFIVALIFLFISCHQEKRPEQSADLNFPPDELIRSNFTAAELVLSLKPDSLKIVKTIYADNGDPGYVIVEVAGEVQDCYKGPMSVGEPVRYQFFGEFEENILENWQKKDLLLVFLKKDEKSGELRAIEFGQFELTPELLSKVRSYRKN